MEISALLGLLGGGGGAAAGAGGAGAGLLGTALGAATGPVGMAVSAIPAIAKFFTGRAQARKARAINPVDPGFAVNSGIMDNKRLVDERFGNYSLPGKEQIVNNLDRNFATALATSTQAAGSGGDVLDAVTKLQSNQDNALANVGLQEASNKDAMFGQVLDANAAAGNELVKKNEYDRQKYDQRVAEKAALNNAAAQNKFGALDQGAKAIGSMLNYKAQPATSNIPPIDVGGSSFPVADLPKAGSVGVNPNLTPTGTLPNMGGQAVLWRQLNKLRNGQQL